MLAFGARASRLSWPWCGRSIEEDKWNARRMPLKWHKRSIQKMKAAVFKMPKSKTRRRRDESRYEMKKASEELFDSFYHSSTAPCV